MTAASDESEAIEVIGSYQQEWIFESTTSGLSTTNVPLVVKFEGAIDRPSVLRSMTRLFRRHDALRTRLRQGAEGLVQVVDPDVRMALTSPITAVEADVGAVIEAELAVPFHLQGGALARARVFDRSDEEMIVALSAHHAISDGWSVGVLFEDLVALYREECGAGPTVVDGPALQYGDYAEWERGLALDGDARFWRARLDGSASGVRLPGARRPVSGPAWRSRLRPLSEVDASTVRRLEVLAASAQTTMAAVLGAAAVATVAPFITGDVVVGVTVANRQQATMRGVIGFVAYELPVRVAVPSEASFLDLVRGFGAAMADAYDHQVPTGVLGDLLSRTGSEVAPMFDIKLNYSLPTAVGETTISEKGSAVRVTDIGGAREQFEYAADRWWRICGLVEFRPSHAVGGGLAGHMLANDAAVPESVAERLREAYGRTLRRMAADPRRVARVGDLLADGSEAQ
jgi:hypothetical protein